MNIRKMASNKDHETQIRESSDEIDVVLNFLRENEFLNPETPILAKKGRGADYLKDFHRLEEIYHTVDKWDKPELKYYMLIPKELKAKEPVRFHVYFSDLSFQLLCLVFSYVR